MKIQPIKKHPAMEKLDAEIVALQHRLAQAEQAVTTCWDFRARALQPDALSGAAREFLTTGEIAPAGTPNDAEYQALVHRRDVIRRALELKQKDKADLHVKVSREINTEIEPAYRDTIREIVEVLTRQLAPLLDREHEIRGGLQDAGYSWTLTALPLNALGRLSDPNSRASIYIAEARKHGYIR